MFLFVDESGRDDYFLITILRFTTRETLDRLRRLVRRTRKRFEGHLRRTGALDAGLQLRCLSGAKKQAPGIGQYPEQCLWFFKQLAHIFEDGKNCQLYVIGFQPSPGQTLPGTHLPNSPNRRPGRSKALAKARIYTAILGDLLSSIQAFPRLSSPEKTFTCGPRKNSVTTQKIAILVIDNMTYPSAVRRAVSQRCFSTLKRKRKLRGARLQVWFNDDKKDYCLQVVDVLANFFFQAHRLGIEVTKAPANPASFREKPPAMGMSYWTGEQWHQAFKVLEPSCDYWKPRRWLFRPTRSLRTPARRTARRRKP